MSPSYRIGSVVTFHVKVLNLCCCDLEWPFFKKISSIFQTSKLISFLVSENKASLLNATAQGQQKQAGTAPLPLHFLKKFFKI